MKYYFRMKYCLIQRASFSAVFIIFFFIFPTLSGQERAPAAPRPASRQQPRIISPELLPDNRVTLRIFSRDAVRVSVTGEWQTGTSGTETLVSNDSGLFKITIGPLKPELYGYNFTVDGVATIDPANPQVRRDGVRYQNFFIVPGNESDLYFQKNDIPHGTILKVWYHSEILGMDRRVYIYTPPGYATGKQKYPVFYLLHGAGGDEDAWTNMGRAAQIMDNLIAQGRAVPMIVVMPNGNANEAGSRNDIPATTAGPVAARNQGQPAGGSFETHLVKDLEPYINKNFRVLNGMNNRAIAGLSMGGMHTQTITNDNPGIFGYIGVFSMGIMNNSPRTQDVSGIEKERDAKIEALKKSGYKLYWIGCGESDMAYDNTKRLIKGLNDLGMKYTNFDKVGGHTWDTWRVCLKELAPLLFK